MVHAGGKMPNTVRASVTALAVASLVLTALPAMAQSRQLALRSMLRRAQEEQEADLLTRPARLRVFDLSLGAALAELQSASGVPLIFSPSLLDGKGKVSCDCTDLSVGRALDRLLAGLGFKYSQLRQSILIEPVERTENTKRPVLDHRVVGHVVDSLSRAPIGAGEVAVIGTSTIVQIGADGRFAVAAP